jgi:DNA-binding transcriptional MocR family regulator
VSARVLLSAVGSWRERPGSGYRALAAGVSEAVDRGDLPTGVLLPAERSLASAAGVSRGTVVAANDVLREQVVVVRRQGSGTWVRAGREAPALPELAAGVRSRRLTERLTERTIAPVPDVVDLGISVVTDLDGLPAGSLDVGTDELAEAAGLHGYQPLGVPALRTAIAARCTERGLPTGPEQIAVTLGSQHGIALAVRLLARLGDLVAVEVPTYPGAIDALSREGVRFAGIATDGAGMRVDELARVCDEGPPRVVYVVPTAHNPRGTVMPDHRRRELAHLADRVDSWIIEDETLSALAFTGGEPPPVASFSRSGRVVTLGSFSKVVWGGLRVGWMRAPAPLVGRVGRLRAATDLGGTALSQLVALRAVPLLDELAAARRRQLAERAALLAALLAEHLPGWAFRPPDGGLSLWVALPEVPGAAGPAVGDRFAEAALRHGVAVLPGGAASVDSSHLDHIRLSFSLPPDLLRAAVERLALAAGELWP